jgi:hypothetical protein
MDKTLENMKKELERLEEELDEASWNYSQFNDKVIKYRLNNGLYHPMSELTNYIRKDINEITIVIKNEDGMLETLRLCDYRDDDYDCCIDWQGHILYHSDSEGIIRYDDYTNKYVHVEGYNIVYHDFIGFMNLSFADYRIDDIW